jgi:hypothetical protein
MLRTALQQPPPPAVVEVDFMTPRRNPKPPADSLFQQTDRTRKLVRGEICRLLDHVE